MLYDISFLWPWLLLAAVIGLAVGMSAEPPDFGQSWRESWFKQALIAIVVALVVAWLHILPGRAAFWWESAILFAIVYLLAGVVGGRFPRKSASS